MKASVTSVSCYQQSETSQLPFPAVILAAGQGRRLRAHTNGTPKPITPVLGLTLLQRAILSCQKARIHHIIVVVGYKKREVIRHAHRIAAQHGIELTIVENPYWPKGNGSSLLAAEPYVNSPFFLLMADHIFDPAVLERLAQVYQQNPGSYVVVDRNLERVDDVQEATKVHLDGREVLALGKQLKEFQAVDTGIFLLEPSVFSMVREAVMNGDGSLSGAMNVLAACGLLNWMDIGPGYWIDVDTPQNLRMAQKLLQDHATKPSEDGPISRWINRRFSRWLTRWLVNLPLTPTQVTWLSFSLALLAAGLFLVPGSWAVILAGLLVQVASIVDGCDGEIARLKFQSSPRGGWIDTLLDRYADCAIALAITWRAWQTTGQPLVWIGGLLAISGLLIYGYGKKEFQLHFHCSWRMHPFLGRVPASRDVRLFIIFLGALLQHPFLALVMTGLLSHAAIVFSLLVPYVPVQSAR